ncbi:unnamed protein product [Bursaphelenchus xylophilus]|uniref:(pine wood nematode) hypothetical protein n=1 Tax=Bursaphelenchus xylophilus TaxID=6326 RepID=A0A1I7SR53_BURXY|nr:unnamed protein product [Bursaphelenchus xylophilus]CAG9110845.1 unnamed protein product [Bursaphelenchus xylophilus]
MTRPNNFYGTYPLKQNDFHPTDEVDGAGNVRSILRKGHRDSSASRGYYDMYPEPAMTLPRKPIYRESKLRVFFDRLVRPCAAEFLAVFLSVYIYKHIETQLTDRQVQFFLRIIILSFTDAALMGIYLTSFGTVQMSPAITLAQLFSLNTPWFLCIFLFAMQFLGGLSGIGLFYLSHSGMFPTLPKLVLDMEGDFTGSANELIICQIAGTIGAVISYMMVTRPVGSERVYVSRLYTSSVGPVTAVGLGTFLSLLHSNIPWNPVNAFSLTLFHFLRGNNAYVWHNHYVYWLGPVLGSLAACFLYRFILAPRESRERIRPLNLPRPELF